MTTVHTGGIDQATLLVRTKDGVGFLFEFPSGEITATAVYGQMSMRAFGVDNTYLAGLDVTVNGGHGSTMTIVANFDDLFNRVRQDADTTDRGLPAAAPELEQTT